MKKIKLLAALFTALIMIIGTGCERVAPNYAGVLMENFERTAKTTFRLLKVASGRWLLVRSYFRFHCSTSEGTLTVA